MRHIGHELSHQHWGFCMMGQIDSNYLYDQYGERVCPTSLRDHIQCYMPLEIYGLARIVNRILFPGVCLW
jgi:hypothetical protein